MNRILKLKTKWALSGKLLFVACHNRNDFEFALHRDPDHLRVTWEGFKYIIKLLNITPEITKINPGQVKVLRNADRIEIDYLYAPIEDELSEETAE